MRSRLNRFRLTPAFPIALMAMFVALGGIGYAAATVNSGDVKNNSLTTKDIKNKSLKKKDLAFQIQSGIQGVSGPAGLPGAQGDPGVPGGTGAQGPQGVGGTQGISGPGTAFVDILSPAVVSDHSDVSAGGFTLRAISANGVCQGTLLLGHPTQESFQQHFRMAPTAADFNGTVDDRNTDPDGEQITFAGSVPGMWQLIVRTQDGNAAAVFQWTLDNQGPGGAAAGCYFAGQAIGTS
jgi:hypothetical protein